MLQQLITFAGSSSDDRGTTRPADDRGASLVEYALLLALIAVVCIAAVSYFGTSTADSLSQSGSTIFLGN